MNLPEDRLPPSAGKTTKLMTRVFREPGKSPKFSRAREEWHFRYSAAGYSYCYDTVRYDVPPPEDVIMTAEKERFTDTGWLNLVKVILKCIEQGNYGGGIGPPRWCRLICSTS
ncbi:hypothetical protein F2Q70_00013126 [Brassica cretica]|uniref:Uncharacterized protein n=1 Tax=Brassica cretica TaxID=69181 RepID=A0A8S9M9H1_BRACR|nr:hypothetical protein F2Q70_00013126 [Brassica cretica]